MKLFSIRVRSGRSSRPKVNIREGFDFTKKENQFPPRYVLNDSRLSLILSPTLESRMKENTLHDGFIWSGVPTGEGMMDNVDQRVMSEEKVAQPQSILVHLQVDLPLRSPECKVVPFSKREDPLLRSIDSHRCKSLIICLDAGEYVNLVLGEEEYQVMCTSKLALRVSSSTKVIWPKTRSRLMSIWLRLVQKSKEGDPVRRVVSIV